MTIVCETAKQELFGFEWLTHSADYANFPASLIVTCVFDNNHSVDSMLASHADQHLRKMIQQQLLNAGILLKDVRRHVCFDSEQACLEQHAGDWKKRLTAG